VKIKPFSILLIFLLFSDNCLSQKRTISKNEAGLLLSLERDVKINPAYGVYYGRSISKDNKLWLYGVHMRKDIDWNNWKYMSRVYEVGAEYRMRPFKTLPLYFSPSAGFTYAKWFNSYYSRFSVIEQERFTHNYMINLTGNVLFGNKIKLSLGKDIGFGIVNSTVTTYVSGMQELQSSGNSLSSFIVKLWHVRVSYMF
jgi:hypothetical protein